MRSWLVKGPLLLIFAIVLTEVYCWVAIPNIKIGPSFRQPDPELGMAQRKNYVGRRFTHDYDMVWTTGAQGFRGDSYPRDKAAGITRIASLGNSHTFGVGVEDDETYSELIGEGLGQAEVINMAVTDAGTGIFLRTWDDILSYQPDALVIRYDSWNFQRPFKHYLPGEGPLEARHYTQKTSPLTFLESTPLQHSGFWGLLRLRYTTISAGLSQTKCRLSTLRTVSSTECIDNETDLARDRRVAQEARILAAFAEKISALEIPVIYLRFALREPQAEVFEALIPPLENVTVLDFSHLVGDPAYNFPVDLHLNRDGHTYVAERLTAELQKRLDRT